VVLIPTDTTVTYDVNSATALKAVGIDGVLDWGTTGTKRMVTSELVVKPSGYLKIGTEAAPFTGTALVEFSGTLATGTVPSPGVDPEQWGVGLIVMGKIRVHGEAKTSFVRVASAISASTSTIPLASTPTNWDSGDEVVLLESLQRSDGGSPDIYQNNPTLRNDRRTLSANVTTASAGLSSSTTYAHPCSAADKDGVANLFCPHVANMSRNVRFISTNPGGVRGHSIYVDYADVDIRYAEYAGMGRTTDANLNCTLRTTGASQGSEGANCTTGTGAITQIGTNHKGRYAVHFHHLWGPPVSESAYQAIFQGNVVKDATKWNMTIHFTNYAHIADNVVAFGKGPAIFGEEYGEHHNVIERNLMTGQTGSVSPRGEDNGVIAAGGREPCGIWMSGGMDNTIRDNVAAGFGNTFMEVVSECGFKFFMDPASTTSKARIPSFRGASLATGSGEYTTANPLYVPITEFSGNEAYGLATCFTIWHHGSDGYTAPDGATPWSTISNLKCWAAWENGILFYPIHRFIVDGMVFRGDASKATEFSGPNGIVGVDYKMNDDIFRNLDLQGVRHGIRDTGGWDGDIIIENVTTYARLGIVISAYSTPGTSATPTDNRTMTIRNFQHTTFSGVAARTIVKAFTNDGNFQPNLPETVMVENYNGTTADFQLYYVEQISSAVAGGLAPCSDTTTYPAITGVVCNITPSPAPEATFWLGLNRNKRPGSSGGFTLTK
jgi:hypothetical protein